MVPARGDALSAGQRTHVQNHVCLEILVRIDHTVRDDQSALCVGVVDFNRPANTNVSKGCM